MRTLRAVTLQLHEKQYKTIQSLKQRLQTEANRTGVDTRALQHAQKQIKC